ncbi:metal ABC transporter substrate-binding protein [Methylomagnum sp.]
MTEHSPARRRALVSLCLLAASPLARAGSTGSPTLKIVASNYPLAYFAERLGGARVAVNFPAPADVDPAFWRPDAKSVGTMQRADLIALNGADYEKWLPHVALPRLKTVDTAAGFKDAFIHIENAVTHSHGPGGTHSHGGTAFTTWLDFEQAAQQAQALADAIARKRPEWKSLIAENLAGLKADLAALDAELKAIAATKPGLPLLASHPVYQYPARRYGLNLHSVHWEANETPPAEEWRALERTLASHPAKWMLWEAEPSPDIAAKLQALGVASLPFEPCANRPEAGDFLSVMKRNAANLKAAFQ